MPYVIAVERYFHEARKITGSGDGTKLWKLPGVNGLQGTPRSEELGGKYHLESREFVMGSRRQHINSPKHVQMWYYAGFREGGALARLPFLAPEYISHLQFYLYIYRNLYYCFCYTDEPNDIQK